MKLGKVPDLLVSQGREGRNSERCQTPYSGSRGAGKVGGRERGREQKWEKICFMSSEGLVVGRLCRQFVDCVWQICSHDDVPQSCMQTSLWFNFHPFCNTCDIGRLVN